MHQENIVSISGSSNRSVSQEAARFGRSARAFAVTFALLAGVSLAACSTTVEPETDEAVSTANEAIDEMWPLAKSCQFPSAVSVYSTCSGVYLGNGVAVTAAHCIRDQGSPPSLSFGEGEDHSINVTGDCVVHPSHTPWSGKGGAYNGVDLAFCKLASSPKVPVIPPMIEGCESDYLATKVFTSNGAVGVAVAFGMEGADWTGKSYHRKRIATVDIRGEKTYSGSRKLWGAESYGKAIWSGDSGGPLYFQMADGTYRLLGLVHGTGIVPTNSSGDAVGTYWQSLPAYVRWIEATSGRDVTPCHDWSATDHAYRFNNQCKNKLPKNPYQSITNGWDTFCSAGALSGAQVNVPAGQSRRLPPFSPFNAQAFRWPQHNGRNLLKDVRPSEEYTAPYLPALQTTTSLCPCRPI